jgi:hypothetical protein
MLPEPEFLRSLESADPIERAAAIAHRVYVYTAQRVGWELRVPEDWHELDAEAKTFNAEAAKTWADDDELYEAWVEAMKEVRRRRQ